MAAEVKFHPLGFAVEDDFGPEGRRFVLAPRGDGMGVLIFHGRVWADQYAAMRDRLQELWVEAGGQYSDAFLDVREAAKALARERGKVYELAAR